MILRILIILLLSVSVSHAGMLQGIVGGQKASAGISVTGSIANSVTHTGASVSCTSPTSRNTSTCTISHNSGYVTFANSTNSVFIVDGCGAVQSVTNTNGTTDSYTTVAVTAPCSVSFIVGNYDNFNRSDNSNLGTNWTQNGNCSIVGNQLSGGSFCLAYWSANSFNSNHCAQVSIYDANDQSDAVVRTDGTNFYELIRAASTMALYSTGSCGLMYTWSTAIWQSGDTDRLCANGTTFTAYLNGSALSPTTTCSDFATGNAGLRVNLTVLDNFYAWDQ